MILRKALLIASLPAAVLTSQMIPCGSAQAEPNDGQGQTRGIYLQMIQKARIDGRSRAAIAYLDDYDRKYSGDTEAKVLRINCLLDLRQIAEAQGLVNRLPFERSGRFAAIINAVRGHVLAAQDRWGEAVPFYTAAVAADPTSGMLHNALGYALLRDHRFDRATVRTPARCAASLMSDRPQPQRCRTAPPRPSDLAPPAHGHARH